MGWIEMPGGGRLHDGNWTEEEEMDIYERTSHVKAFTKPEKGWTGPKGSEPEDEGEQPKQGSDE